MAICPIICSFYYLARALMHDVAGEIACAEGCAETISANVLKLGSSVWTLFLLCVTDLTKVKFTMSMIETIDWVNK